MSNTAPIQQPVPTRRPLYPRNPNIQAASRPSTPPIKHRDDIFEAFKNIRIRDDDEGEKPASTSKAKGTTTTTKAAGKRKHRDMRHDGDRMDIDSDIIPHKRRHFHRSKRSPLESVPLEVFDSIVSQLPPRAILRLRLVNSKLEALVRQAAFTKVVVDVGTTADGYDNPMTRALLSSPHLFSTVRELTLNTEAQWYGNLNTVFPITNDAWRCDMLYHVAAMYNLRTLNFGFPDHGGFQLHSRNYISFVRECFEALFHEGEDAEGQEWFTRFLNLTKLSVVLPLTTFYKQPVTLQHLLNKLEEFEFRAYPNSYSAHDFRGSRMFAVLQDGFLSYLTDRLKRLTISFPTPAPGHIGIPVKGYTGLTHLTIIGFVVPESSSFFNDVCGLPALQHLTLDAHIDCPTDGPRKQNRWKDLYARLKSSPRALLYFKNRALERGGTGYAANYRMVGYRDVACWETISWKESISHQPVWSFMSEKIWEDRKQGVRDCVAADEKARAELVGALEDKRRNKKEEQEGSSRSTPPPLPSVCPPL